MLHKTGIIALSLFSGLSLANTQYEEIIDSAAEQLKDGYVFPKIGEKYASALEKCKQSSCLDGVSEDEQAAKLLTQMLNSVYPDKHLHVFPPGYVSPIPKMKMVKKGKGSKVPSDTGIVKQEILPGNIGYIEFSMFPGFPEAFDATQLAMEKLEDTDAVIFDIREHRGGHPKHVDIIASFLFDEPTHLLTTRSPHNPDGKPWKLMSAPNKYAGDFKDKPVYLLISERSGSAAEHFAMAMKASGRAILVGETTGGYGHWGEEVALDGGFSMFLPRGGSYHPKTGLGWEEIGVTPDVEIDSEDSLTYALDRIKAFL